MHSFALDNLPSFIDTVRTSGHWRLSPRRKSISERLEKIGGDTEFLRAGVDHVVARTLLDLEIGPVVAVEHLSAPRGNDALGVATIRQNRAEPRTSGVPAEGRFIEPRQSVRAEN